MIPQRKILRALMGLLGVAGVGLLLMPMVNGWAQAPPGAKDKKEKGSEAEIKAARDEVKAAQETMDKAQKEFMKAMLKLAKAEGRPFDPKGLPGPGGNVEIRLNTLERKLDTLLMEIKAMRMDKIGPKDKKIPEKTPPAPPLPVRPVVEPNLAPTPPTPRLKVDDLPANPRP